MNLKEINKPFMTPSEQNITGINPASDKKPAIVPKRYENKNGADS